MPLFFFGLPWEHGDLSPDLELNLYPAVEAGVLTTRLPEGPHTCHSLSYINCGQTIAQWSNTVTPPPILLNVFRRQSNCVSFIYYCLWLYSSHNECSE